MIGAGSVVDRSILDKEVVVGKNCRIGYGDDRTPNKQEPSRLNTGITLVGKRSRLPDNLTVGRNCKIGTDLRPAGLPRPTRWLAAKRSRTAHSPTAGSVKWPAGRPLFRWRPRFRVHAQ